VQSTTATAAPPALAYAKGDIWCGITNTMEGSGEDRGFCTHAFNGGAWDRNESDKSRGMRSLCGVRLAELPNSSLDKDRWEPGCLRCKKALIAMGLLTPHESAT
jgi:hypothetical protein